MNMTGKYLRYYAFCLLFMLASTAPLLTEAASTSTSKEVDITVTHVGTPPPGVLTTGTYKNLSGSTMPAGTPVSFGQGFRYGDIMPGTHPDIRDAATHVSLAGQQWDEISTWRENGGNGSWRHAVWAAWLPKSLAPGATFHIEFVATAGSYSESSHQSLSALCSGPAAHDLKLHLTDVRNQDDTVRDSGDAIFRVCDNINNVGRDAPRHTRAGNVVDEYIVSGVPVYTSGHKDPTLYAQAVIDIYTKASDGVSAGDVKWVIENHNSWMNVAAGSTGNAGNPGPAGFANDPNSISYRYEVLDGATVVLDQSNFDAVISSASNPISPAGTPACQSTVSAGPGASACMTVASSTGLNTWVDGQATRISCSGTCVAGLTNGQLYYVWPSSSATSSGSNTTMISLMKGPKIGDAWAMTNAQGTGTTSFSTRVQHYDKETWLTLDPSGQANWSPFGTTTRATRKMYPAFTDPEKTYWEQTGLIIPLWLGQAAPTVGIRYSGGANPSYAPLARGTVIGGGPGGASPDLGITNEYSAAAFLLQGESNWDSMVFFTLGGMAHSVSTLFDESSGRIPPLNNGPPTGPGGNGGGGSYAGLGPFRNQATWGPGPPAGMITGANKTNPSGITIEGGVTGGGTAPDHMPNFDGFTYIFMGDRHYLDALYWHANKDFLWQQVGPGPELGQGYYRDNNAVGPDGNQHHYWGLLTSCCQTRGSNWIIRDVTYGATFGGDSNVERSYFGDLLTETANYWPLFLKFKDGPVGTGYSGSVVPPNDPIDGTAELTAFQIAYTANVAYINQTWLHNPMAGVWNTKLQRFTEGIMGGRLNGMGNGPGLLPTFYVSAFDNQPALHDGDYGWFGGGSTQRGNIGSAFNGTDATDYSLAIFWMAVLSGGQLQLSGSNGCVSCPGGVPVQVGDQIKSIAPWDDYPGGGPNMDQLVGTVWYDVIGPVDAANGTFYLKCPIGHAVTSTCPTPGAAFTGYTLRGTPANNVSRISFVKWRPQYDPGAGSDFVDTNYTPAMGQIANGLQILGYNVARAQSEFARRTGRTGPICNTNGPSFCWDTTIVVPGLPAPVNGL